MKYKKLKKTLEEIFEEDATMVAILIQYVEYTYEIWRKNDKSKK